MYFDNFIKKSAEAGITGLIIPDLPYEEAQELIDKLNKNNIAFIPLVSVTSKDRIPKLVSQGSGFIYAIASLGVTGTKQVSPDRLTDFINEIKELLQDFNFSIKTVGITKHIENNLIEVEAITKIATDSQNLDKMIGKMSKIDGLKKFTIH